MTTFFPLLLLCIIFIFLPFIYIALLMRRFKRGVYLWLALPLTLFSDYLGYALMTNSSYALLIMPVIIWHLAVVAALLALIIMIRHIKGRCKKRHTEKRDKAYQSMLQMRKRLASSQKQSNEHK
jgi:uncharacterized membrane protein